MNEEFLTCKNCGANNLASQDICSNCGFPLEHKEKIKKESKIKNINFLAILKFIIALMSFGLFIMGVLNSKNLFSNGFFIEKNEKFSVQFLFILECIAPIFYLIPSIYFIIKRKSKKTSTNVILTILYLISTIAFIIPLLFFPDIFYIILEPNKYSPLNIFTVLSMEFLLFYIFILLNNIKFFNKKVFKILLIILYIILAILIFIITIKILKPSDFLMPDF